MLKDRISGTRCVIAAACVLTIALIGPSGAQQQGGGGAGPGVDTRAGPQGGGGRGSDTTNRSGGGTASRRTASPRAERSRDRNRRFAAGRRSRPRIGIHMGFGYSAGCGDLRRRARATGSPHWWRRYRACRGW
jgi:hypothetical protein